ncbi:MAG TPA: macro domain-containing protein, partial [bacterium]|nr:macro domain-containing protein [bacterium]
GEDEVLASCYRSSLALADAHGLKRVAFPAISTGAYGFPLRRATAIAVEAVAGHLRQSQQGGQVLFVCFDEPTAAVYREELAQAGRE